MLLALDQLAWVILAGPVYIVRGGRPINADETISSAVGRRSIDGARWAKLCEKIIDAMFKVFTGEPGHCRRAIEWDEVRTY